MEVDVQRLVAGAMDLMIFAKLDGNDNAVSTNVDHVSPVLISNQGFESAAPICVRTDLGRCDKLNTAQAS